MVLKLHVDTIQIWSNLEFYTQYNNNFEKVLFSDTINLLLKKAYCLLINCFHKRFMNQFSEKGFDF
ncbi:hypothetical protein BpHYR1_045501 [Brachionus plicatilis]|uniref:Uncharacterized protein n=1 Tax=Brachionus plicatilis TaxID=10195 RepID=A0A3M7P258_BRAPC|nr:hypothetical protein BpHYR1_045501 [Brachionus plicatilis]